MLDVRASWVSDLLTVKATAVEVDVRYLFVASLILAVRECAPTTRFAILRVAIPLARVPVPIPVVPS